jgi:hypothetical protein
MFCGMLLLYLTCELLAWLAVGRKRQQAPQRRVQQYTQFRRYDGAKLAAWLIYFFGGEGDESGDW